MKRVLHGVIMSLAILVPVGLWGCAADTSKESAAAVFLRWPEDLRTLLDAYYARNHRLPGTLAELKAFDLAGPRLMRWGRTEDLDMSFALLPEREVQIRVFWRGRRPAGEGINAQEPILKFSLGPLLGVE